MGVGQIIFLFILIITGYISYVLYGRVWRNIRLGKKEVLRDQPARRLKNVLLIAFGQKKMFKRIIPAVFHLFIYLAFVITQIALIEILIDGITGSHRVLASRLGGVYTFVLSFIEVLSVLALIATIVFLVRRLILRVPRFQNREMRGWPSRDAIIILVLELVLITAIFTMHGADMVLQNLLPDQYPATGMLPVSGRLGPWLFGGLDLPALMILERTGWWLHILVVFGFLIYLPVSKHLHILLAFPNTYFARLDPPGKMQNMPEVMNEVKSMLGIGEDGDGSDMSEELPEFGAKDVMDLSWKNILDAYTCTECGRCTAVCPANITGKKLSPRKVVMDVRDRAEEVGRALDADPELTKENFEDGKSLFDRITSEELAACTTCNACVEACPVLINPLEIILQMRRYEILTLSAGPSEWVPMFNALENTGAVWQMPEERDAWTKD